MSHDSNSRLVYSTDGGQIKEQNAPQSSSPFPTDGVVRMRVLQQELLAKPLPVAVRALLQPVGPLALVALAAGAFGALLPGNVVTNWQLTFRGAFDLGTMTVTQRR